MDQTTNSKNILVTGVSGHLARAVVDGLLKQGHKNIIGTTRRPEKAEALKAQGVQIRAANFDQPETLTEAFHGADIMLLVSTNKIGQRLNQHRHAIEAAKAAGVKHIVYTSIQNADQFHSVVAAEHLGTENLIKDSGLNYTILRNNLYTDGLLMKTKPSLQWGFFAGCAEDGAVAYVSRADCARAAVAAVMSPQAPQSVLDINGPQALTYSQVAQCIATLTGKKYEYRNESTEAYKAALQKFGMPEAFVQIVVDFDLMAKEGHLKTSGPALKELTGTEGESAEAFLMRHKDFFNN